MRNKKTRDACGDRMKSREEEGKIGKRISSKINFDGSYRLAKSGN